MFGFSVRATRFIIAATTLLALPLAAGAAENDATSQPKEENFASAAVMDSELDSSRGAFVPNTINFNSLSANNTGNTVIGGVTGNNFISNSSFNNSSGLVNVIQNSGNNVVIQSSTIVNMTLNQ